MNLTNLRRVVQAADVLALAAAGAAAWFSLQAAPAAAKDWPKLFPVRPAQSTDLQPSDLPPKDEFIRAIDFVQGDKPPPPDNTPAAVVVKVDPFQSKYKLNGIFLGSRMDSSVAQLIHVQGGNTIFSVGLGGQIPVEPGKIDAAPALTPWRLNELREGGWDQATKQQVPAAAVFIHTETEEKQTLEMVPGNPGPFPPDIVLGITGPGIGVAQNSGPRLEQSFRGTRILTGDPDRIEWNISEEEVDYMAVFSSNQAAKVSIVESRDAAGNPDGFVLKGVPRDSRAADVGFASEDKVISVNDEKVTSTTDAMSKGKKQFEGGKTVFQIKVLRKGKEMTFTFHAPKKKAKS